MINNYKHYINDIDLLINDIIKDHRKLFPKARLIGQIKHYFSEVKEQKQAISIQAQREELADIFITLCGIIRFVPFLRRTFVKKFLKRFTNNKLPLHILKAILCKMYINNRRVWVYKGHGDYHHE